MNTDDRRAAGVRRVAVSTLVEICGRDSKVPAFEAESVELSGRGMHVRTAYLPDLNAPLVLRFEDGEAREVVVEGEVSWRRETDGGGEFGIRFTALDSSSVEVLKQLCGIGEARQERVPSPAPAPVAPPSLEPAVVRVGRQPGGAVKLHIQGLAAPMKARVRSVGDHRLHVGSNLEFLKVGRGLEIEDVERGARESAQIDSVSVCVDPQTEVPQLVVALRYPDSTPEPSVVDSSLDDEAYSEPLHQHHRPTIGPESAEEAALEMEDMGPDDGDELGATGVEESEPPPAWFARVSEFAVGARSAAFSASEQMGRLGSNAGQQVSRLWNRAMAGSEAIVGKEPRRRTAAAPRGAFPPDGRRAPRRPVQGQPGVNRRPPPPAAPGKTRKLTRKQISLFLAVVSVLAVVAWLRARPESSKPVAAQATPASESVALEPAAVVEETGEALAEAAPDGPRALDTTEQAEQPDGIVANVPLFGPQPMATEKPEPLEPPPAAKAAPAAPDESFDDGEKAAAPKPEPEAKSEGVKRWGRGKLHLPIVHRLRLDGRGESVEGEPRASGFSVTIPGRKVMENGRAIEKRDDRIVRVTTKNTDKGAQVSFRFRKSVPPYKVRLRKDFVEFFISSPEK